MVDFLNLISLLLIPFIITVILIHGLYKKVPVYEVFTSGAKEGLFVAIKVLPYLVAIIVAVSMFRASGAIDVISEIFKKPLEYFNIPIDSVPLMITRSLSGSASLGIFSDIVQNNGADSYASKLSAVIIGSSETTFYVLAVYFGAIQIKKYRFALISGVLADIFGIFVAIFISNIFFG